MTSDTDEQVPTMEQLRSQLTSGGRISWKAVKTRDGVKERFFRVYQSWDYRPGRFTWANQEDIHVTSWFRPRTILSEVALPQISFEGPAKDVVDFYGTSNEFSFVSDRLYQLLATLDPDSIDSRSLQLITRDTSLPFHAVLPTRSVPAIDVARTDIDLTDQNIMTKVVPMFDFPTGMVFNNAELGEATNFCELHTGGWYWSEDLLHAAEERGARGLYAVSKAAPRDREHIRL